MRQLSSSSVEHAHQELSSKFTCLFQFCAFEYISGPIVTGFQPSRLKAPIPGSVRDSVHAQWYFPPAAPSSVLLLLSFTLPVILVDRSQHSLRFSLGRAVVDKHE